MVIDVRIGIVGVYEPSTTIRCLDCGTCGLMASNDKERRLDQMEQKIKHFIHQYIGCVIMNGEQSSDPC